MNAGERGSVLWRPSKERLETASLTRFTEFLRQRHDVALEAYSDLHAWSISDLARFWGDVWDYCGLEASVLPSAIIEDEGKMPGTRWLVGAQLNYARHALRGAPGNAAVVAFDESGRQSRLNLEELRAEVARIAGGLRDEGIGVGDRVAAYLPNITEAVISFLATVSLGAVWSSCAPEFGARSVIDRFAQIRPKVLIATTSYRYGGQDHDRRQEIEQIEDSLPSLEKSVLIGDFSSRPNRLSWDSFGQAGETLRFQDVASSHPLWIVYSSGTTGPPKPIIHSHGGILLEHSKSHSLHLDLGASDVFFWYTSTGWVMWNLLVSGLLVDAAIVLYDGHPTHPGFDYLWSVAEEAECTAFGVGAPLLEAWARGGIGPGEDFDLTSLKVLGSTGAPLGAASYEWVYSAVDEDLLLGSISGGTDVCTAFVGCAPTLPVRAGEIQCRWLGVAAEAFSSSGHPLVGETGELVITRPMPSMPIGFEGDSDGSRYRSAYFEAFEGAWRHGDWIRFYEDGSCEVTGRSDSTLKRGGVRMGTADFYDVVEEFSEVSESLVVDTTGPGGSGELVLFVVLSAECSQLTPAIVQRIRESLGSALSPRHVPDRVIRVNSIPRTLNGKKLEVPVKRMLLGEPVDDVVAGDSVSNPRSVPDLLEAARAAGLIATNPLS